MNEKPETLTSLCHQLRRLSDVAGEQVDAERMSRAACEIEALAADRDTLRARAEAAEAKVREQALDYLALDGQAIEALAERDRLRAAVDALLIAAHQVDGQEAHRIMPYIWPHIQALAALTASSRPDTPR